MPSNINGMPEWIKSVLVQHTIANKLWRPANWPNIKRLIDERTQVEFSPSRGYSGGTKDIVMETTASALLEAILNGMDKNSVTK